MVVPRRKQPDGGKPKGAAPPGSVIQETSAAARIEACLGARHRFEVRRTVVHHMWDGEPLAT